MGYGEGKESNPYGGTYYGMEAQSTVQGPITERLSGALSLDRSYAMAQSLCVCKAAHTAQELRISCLQEKNYILKEKTLEMQGVLLRWGEDIEATAVQLAMYGNTNDHNYHANSNLYSSSSSRLYNSSSNIQINYENNNLNEKELLTKKINELEKNINDKDIENELYSLLLLLLLYKLLFA